MFPASAGALDGKMATTEHALSAQNLAESLPFAVVLRLRNADELQARINRNEVISYEEMERLYLPLPEDYEAVTQWLKSEGFTITRHDDSRLGVYAHGTVAQVQTSLQVHMVGVTVEGMDYPVADSAPSLPAEIGAPVLGIEGLLPYLKLKPHHRRVPFKGSRVVTSSDIDTDSTTYPYRSFSPAQILTAYNAANLPFTGSGQRIAIVADVLPATSDLTAFWSRQGVTRTGAFETSTPNGTTGTTPPGVEVTLDSEWSSSIAPAANVRVYAAGSTSFTAFGACLQQMINDIKAGTAIQQLSISYGLGEVDAGSGAGAYFMQFDNSYMLVLAGLGVSIFASTGDDGSTFTQVSGGTSSLQVSYYSSSPNITAVGGTSLGVNADGSYLGENAWSGSGGGSSIVFSRPSWQVGTGVPAGKYRLVPDVCLPADPYTGCDLTFDGQIYDANGNTSGYVEGGTSWSSPTWAGMAALINQSRAAQSPARSTLGLLAARIYPLIGTNNFFDVTTGSNGAYSATTGYDETTGIGSPNMANLLGTLTGPVITGFSPTGGVVGSTVVITGKNLNVTASVKFNGTSAAFTINSSTQITATVPAGATTGAVTVSNPQVTSGVSGDAFTSTASFTVTVPDLTVTSTHAGSFTQADHGDTYIITATNGGTGPVTGTVTVTDTLPSGLTATAFAGSGWTVNLANLSATRSDTLAAGSNYPALTLTVNVSASAPATVTNVAAVSGGGETNTANDTASDPTTITALTPSQSWRYQYFGTTANSGVAADNYIYAGDGLPNLLKYALNLNPLLPAISPLSVDVSTGYLRLTVPRNANANDVTFSVEVNNSALTNESAWTSSGTVVDQNTTSLLQVHDSVPVSQSNEQFIRLRVTR